MVLTFQSVIEILKCDHSNESYSAVLSSGSVYYAVRGDSNFESVDKIVKINYSIRQMKAIKQYFSVVL